MSENDGSEDKGAVRQGVTRARTASVLCVPLVHAFLKKRGGPICRLLIVCGLAGMGMTARTEAQAAWKPRS